MCIRDRFSEPPPAKCIVSLKTQILKHSHLHSCARLIPRPPHRPRTSAQVCGGKKNHYELVTVKKKLWLFVFLTNVSKTQYQHSTPNVSQFQQARYKRRPNAGETLSIARTRRTYTKSDSKDRETQEWFRHATRHRHRQRNETTLATNRK